MNEIERLTNELRTGNDVELRRDASSRLRDIGFARRANLEKRGTVSQAAQSKLEAHELDALHAALEDGDPSVRRNAIITVGDLGDVTSVPALMRHSEDDDPEIRLAAIDSLGDIGGMESISMLTHLATNSDEFAEIRLAALTELEELAAKPITSGPDRRFDPSDEFATATGGADQQNELMRVRVDLAQALNSIDSEVGADDFLRLKAADVRSYLQSGT